MTNQTKWSIDQSHSEIVFKIKHLMIANVRGAFKTFDASIYTAEKDFNSVEIDLWIDPASITTGDEKRDEHLKGADFFDVENHKQITFVSDSIERTDSISNHEMWGKLTIKGITKTVKLNVQFGGIEIDPNGIEKAGFTAVFIIRRSEWGLIWNKTLETGGLLLSDEVKISCEIELSNIVPENLTRELELSSDQKSSL